MSTMIAGQTRPPQASPELSRDLGVSHASAVVVGTIIGSGIFLVPAEMMQAVGSAKLATPMDPWLDFFMHGPGS